MDRRVIEFFEKPTSYKAGVATGIIVVFGAIFYSTLYMPLSSQLEQISATNIASQKKVDELSKVAANLPLFEEEVDSLNIELKRALSELPDQREIPQLLTRISDTARDAGLEILVFKPRPEQKREFYAEVPVEIEVKGSYHQIGAFFDEVGHLERAVGLSNFNFQNPEIGEELVTLQAALTATAFRFLEENERVKPESETKNPRKRSKSATVQKK